MRSQGQDRVRRIRRDACVLKDRVRRIRRDTCVLKDRVRRIRRDHCDAFSSYQSGN